MRPLVPAVAAAAVLVLAGCSEPEPGSPLPTGGGVATSAAPSAAPSETSSATPSTGGAEEPDEATATATATAEPSAAPTLPPEATTNDAAGAEAFVAYWFDSVNFAYDTLNAEVMLSASSSDCDVCMQIDEEIEEYRAQNAQVEGGAFQLGEAIAPAPDGTGVIVVAVVYNQDPYRVVDGAGAVREVDGESASLGAVLRWEGQQWRMFGLGA